MSLGHTRTFDSVKAKSPNAFLGTVFLGRRKEEAPPTPMCYVCRTPDRRLNNYCHRPRMVIDCGGEESACLRQEFWLGGITCEH